jgi:hypothetical protein
LCASIPARALGQPGSDRDTRLQSFGDLNNRSEELNTYSGAMTRGSAFFHAKATRTSNQAVEEVVI